MGIKSAVLTQKQIKALILAWDVLHYGQVSSRYNGGDFTPRNESKCRAAAKVIDALLDQVGYDEDAE